MEELLKKVLYTGVGMVAYTSEKVQKIVSDLVSQSKISEEEGKKIVEDFMKDSEGKREEIEAKVKEVAAKVLANFEFLKKKENDSEGSRAEDIESKLGMTEAAETIVEVK
jgi:polyhydroxyalkanoate synthesis regulator phasin